jgi:hypothetical protein
MGFDKNWPFLRRDASRNSENPPDVDLYRVWWAFDRCFWSDIINQKDNRAVEKTSGGDS